MRGRPLSHIIFCAGYFFSYNIDHHYEQNTNLYSSMPIIGLYLLSYGYRYKIFDKSLVTLTRKSIEFICFDSSTRFSKDARRE